MLCYDLAVSDDGIIEYLDLKVIRWVKTVFFDDIKKFYKVIGQSGRRIEISKEVVFNLLLNDDNGLYSLERGSQKPALEEIKNKIIGLDASVPLTQDVVEPIIREAIYHHSIAFLIEARKVAIQARIEAQRQLAEAQRQLDEVQRRTRTSEHLGDADSKAKKTKTDEGDVSLARSRSPSPFGRRPDAEN